MKEYLSHFSAAITWDIPYIGVILADKITLSDVPHITVTEPNARLRNSGQKVHSCELALPTGAVIVRNGIMVASPELLFLELASKLSLHRLILLGLQMCSHSPGHPSEAVTTKRKLKAFLAKTAGHRGRRKAERAVKYIEDGSASVMESITYMILTLPYSLGGYGLNGAVFNYEIKLKDEMNRRFGQKHFFADLYYKRVKLAVEYESFAHHSSPSEQGKDLMRSSILERQGVDMMHMSTVQLYDRNACRFFAYNLATRLGKRINIRTKRFDEMHTLMRELLPASKPVYNR